jgi:5,6,7,8-tetrahydromethanopterin hydro-lyase
MQYHRRPVDSVTDGTIPLDTVEDLMIIVNVFVHPATLDREQVYLNNYKAMRHAIRKALEGKPCMNKLIENKELSRHPLKYSP